MQYSATLVAAFAATAMAGPILKRAADDLTVVKEKIFVYPDGEIVNTAWETYTTKIQVASSTQVKTSAPTSTTIPAAVPQVATSSVVPAPVAPQASSSSAVAAPAPSASAGSFLQSGASSSQSSAGTTTLADLTNVAVGLNSYISRFANKDVTTSNDWLPFSSDANSLFARMSTYHHNVHRANSSVPALEWDPEIAQAAQNWANSCEDKESIPEGKEYGMNAAWSSSPTNFNPSHWITEAWYNGEYEAFPWGLGDNVPTDENTSNFKLYGHLSQLLWSDSKKFGCGIRPDCNAGKKDAWHVYAACYYYPPGNYPNQFSKVKQPSTGPTIEANGVVA